MKASVKQKIVEDVEILDNLDTQGGGHGQIKRSHSGALHTEILAKPLIERENRFYQYITTTPMRMWVPEYFGVTEQEDDENRQQFLLIEDLTSGIHSPCIADIKIGTRSYEVDASEKKKEAQLSHIKGTTTETHACRMVDVSLRKDGVLIKEWDRISGRQAPLSMFIEVLQKFLPGKRKQEFLGLLNDLIEKLIETKTLNPRSRFYSASLLVIYDGDFIDNPMNIALIDFAHAYVDIDSEGGDSNDSSYDDNTVLGLQNLYKLVAEN